LIVNKLLFYVFSWQFWKSLTDSVILNQHLTDLDSPLPQYPLEFGNYYPDPDSC